MLRNQPLYIQVVDILKQKILNNEYKIDENIPTERELEEGFGVSKITIRKAIEILESEGYVEKKSGKGTKVVSNSLFNKLSKAESFSSILLSKGHKLSKETISIEKIINDANSQVFSIFGEKCNKINRMYYLDSKPYIFFTHYIPFDENLTVENFNNESSLYMYLYRRNINITRFEDEFFIEESELEVSKALNLDKDILLGRKRKTYDESDNIVELSFARYNTEVQNYIIKYEI